MSARGKAAAETAQLAVTERAGPGMVKEPQETRDTWNAGLPVGPLTTAVRVPENPPEGTKSMGRISTAVATSPGGSARVKVSTIWPKRWEWNWRSSTIEAAVPLSPLSAVSAAAHARVALR